MKRVGWICKIRPEKLEEYKRCHAAAWPEILSKIKVCNIRNYSIYLKEPENLMFAYFEYHGTDYDADMARMAADPVTQDWWKICMPCQAPLATRKDGEWWAGMQGVFYTA